MARISGKDGALYAAISSGGTAEPIAFLNNWSISFAIDKYDGTSFDDSNKTYVAGFPDASGTYAGFYDTATAQLYTAATDGVARKFYLYPTTGNTGQYWYGTAIFDFSVSTPVAGIVTISGSFAASSSVSKVG